MEGVFVTQLKHLLLVADMPLRCLPDVLHSGETTLHGFKQVEFQAIRNRSVGHGYGMGSVCWVGQG